METVSVQDVGPSNFGQSGPVPSDTSAPPSYEEAITPVISTVNSPDPADNPEACDPPPGYPPGYSAANPPPLSRTLLMDYPAKSRVKPRAKPVKRSLLSGFVENNSMAAYLSASQGTKQPYTPSMTGSKSSGRMGALEEPLPRRFAPPKEYTANFQPSGSLVSLDNIPEVAGVCKACVKMQSSRHIIRWVLENRQKTQKMLTVLIGISFVAVLALSWRSKNTGSYFTIFLISFLFMQMRLTYDRMKNVHTCGQFK